MTDGAASVGCTPLDTLLPLSAAAVSTLQEIARMHPGNELRPSLFCHETAGQLRELRGWVLDLHASAKASVLPVPYNLFHGVSVALCEADERTILRLMQEPEDTRLRLGRALDAVMGRHHDRRRSREAAADEEEGGCLRASWQRCRPTDALGVPQSLHGATRDRDGQIVFVPDAGPIVDGAPWHPELSPDGFVGLYFRWHEGQARESKLCLYMACQSYLPKACLEFADMVHRIEDACSVGCVSLSEELQWLRNACARNRARLIAEVCEAMGIRVPAVDDYCACRGGPPVSMALVAAETLHHDLRFVSPAAGRGKRGAADMDRVRLLNYCAEANAAFNGSVCAMAPWNGLWVFRGVCSGAMLDEPGCFGHLQGKTYQMLPTAAPLIASRTGIWTYTSSSSGGRRAIVAPCCRVLELWPQPPLPSSPEEEQEDYAEECDDDSADTTTTTTTNSSSKKTSSCSGGIEDDVLFAYRRALALQTTWWRHYRLEAEEEDEDEDNNNNNNNKEQEEATTRTQEGGRRRRRRPITIMRKKDHSSSSRRVEHYLVFDESVLQRMAGMGWVRHHGANKLMPLAVGMYEHWKRQAQDDEDGGGDDGG